MFLLGDEPTDGKNIMQLVGYSKIPGNFRIEFINFITKPDSCIARLWEEMLIYPDKFRKSDDYLNERSQCEEVIDTLVCLTDKRAFSRNGFGLNPNKFEQLIPIEVFDNVLQQLFKRHRDNKRAYWLILDTFVRYVHQKSVMFNLHVFQHGIQTEDLAVLLMCLEHTHYWKPIVNALYAGGVTRLPTSVKDWFQLKEGDPVKTIDELIYDGATAFHRDDFYCGANNPCNLSLEDI
jgi:hypothetical protein